MQRERTIWFGFTAVVIAAILFVVLRDDNGGGDGSQLATGTSVPTTTVVPTTATTRPRPPATPPTTTSATTVVLPPVPTTARPTPQVTVEETVPPQPQPQPTVIITVPPTVPVTTIPPVRYQAGPGTYGVGINLPAGTYVTDGGPFCYWARLSVLTANPTPDQIIASQNTNGLGATVTLFAGDAAFQTSGCATWFQQ